VYLSFILRLFLCLDVHSLNFVVACSFCSSLACVHTPTLHDVHQCIQVRQLMYRARDLDLVVPNDVQYLCTKLQKLYAFSAREIQQVPDLLENCQRQPKEFLLRLKSQTPQKAQQHRTVKEFAPLLRARCGSLHARGSMHSLKRSCTDLQYCCYNDCQNRAPFRERIRTVHT